MDFVEMDMGGSKTGVRSLGTSCQRFGSRGLYQTRTVKRVICGKSHSRPAFRRPLGVGRGEGRGGENKYRVVEGRGDREPAFPCSSHTRKHQPMFSGKCWADNLLDICVTLPEALFSLLALQMVADWPRLLSQHQRRRQRTSE